MQSTQQTEISVPLSQQSWQSSSQSSQGTLSDVWIPPTYNRDKLDQSMEILSDGKFTPLRYTLNKPLDKTHQSTKDYITQKSNEVIQCALGRIAPNQVNTVFQRVYEKYYKPTDKRMETDALTEALVKAYKEANGHQSQIQILSLFVNNFSKTDLCKLVNGLTKYKIDCARNFASKNGPGQIINPPKIMRVRLSKCRIQHFVEFLYSPSFCQAVGYGSKTLHLSSGLQIKIPKMIRTMIASRIITAYEHFCEDNAMEAPSKATLYKIIKVCSASQKRSLKGLDNYTAEGMVGVDLLERIVRKLEETGMAKEKMTEILKKLSEVNQHLKFELKVQAKKNSTCVDHCLTYALTDEQNEDFKTVCDHPHIERCLSCSAIPAVIDEVESCIQISANLPEDTRSELGHDLEQSKNKIKEWQSHIVRACNQEVSKTNIVEKMRSDQALIIMDWAMKYLPQSFRESQQNWFGKQGISWHVTCVVFRKEESEESMFGLVSFIHILQSGN